MKEIPVVFWLVAFGILIVSITWHELCHAMTAKLLGMKIESVHIGLPYRPMLKGKIHGLIFTLSPYILGGGVRINDHEFDNSIWWRRLLVAIMGPVGNLLLAIAVATLMFGFDRGIAVSQGFTEATIVATSRVVSLQIPVHELIGPMALVNFMANVLSVDFPLGLAFCLIVLNISLAVTNLIPLPALDGGIIAFALVSAVCNRLMPTRRTAMINIEQRLRQSTYYVLLAGILVLVLKDALFLLGSRMGWF